MRENHCGFLSNSQSLKELKRKGARGIRNTLTFEHSEGRCFSPSDNVTFCDIGTSCIKNFLLRSLGVIFDSLECRKNAALSDTLFFSRSNFQHPNPSILRGLKLQRLQKKWSLCRDGLSLSLSLQSKLVVRSSIVSKEVADIESLSDLSVLQAQSFRSFFLTVAVTTKFSSAGALVFCSCAPVVAKRKTRHLLRKFLFGMRDSNSRNAQLRLCSDL